MYGMHQTSQRLICENEHQKLVIEAWGANSLRVRATMDAEIRDDLPQALLEPETNEAQIEIAPGWGRITNGRLAAEVSADSQNILFFNPATGEDFLAEETPRHWAPARSFKPVGGDHFKIEVRFKAYEGERMYGLGQHQHGRLDQKGCVIDLAHINTEISIPFLLSSRGYGFLWNNPAIGRVELGQSATRWVAEAAPQLDYWITAGQTAAQIMEQYTQVTGRAPRMPEWALGLWQCKLRYTSQEELLSVAREYRRRGLPLSVIVADFFHWTHAGDWRFDPELWPDPTGMVYELDSMGIKLMVSIWPTVSALSENFLEMQRRGLLVRTERGTPVLMRFVDTHTSGMAHFYFYDATHPEARQFVWEKVHAGYFRHGIKMLWLDEAEPEIEIQHFDNLRYHAGSGLATGNLYPLMYARGFYEALQAEEESEIVNLCRAAWAGSQRYGVVIWSGDIQSSFETLRKQVCAGLNIGLSGMPWWTTDTGGFYGGDPQSPAFRELLLRWFQFSVFCPILRMHGWREPAVRLPVPLGGPNELWSFGEPAYAILKELLFLRERLRPYIQDQMEQAHQNGAPVMRPLFYDFPGDPACSTIEDQYMFGPDLLVAPILYADMRTRPVYLPGEGSWIDAWSGQSLTGGQWITAEAPLERIPLFIRAEAGPLFLAIRGGSPDLDM